MINSLGSARISNRTKNRFETNRGILVISIVWDSTAKPLVEEILNSFGAPQEEYLAALFVKDVVDDYELGTKYVAIRSWIHRSLTHSSAQSYLLYFFLIQLIW